MTDWTWDPTLYAGSASYYPKGRVAYPDTLAQTLAAQLNLDGTGRLLDVGCGPGSLTLLLADLFAEVVGVDADQGMLDEAARAAAKAGMAGAATERPAVDGPVGDGAVGDRAARDRAAGVGAARAGAARAGAAEGRAVDGAAVEGAAVDGAAAVGVAAVRGDAGGGVAGAGVGGRDVRGGAVGSVRWVRMRAEELPGDLGLFRVITFAQSFHWFDRPRVAKAARGMLDAGGVCVHVGATTHRGVESDEGLEFPRPPYSAIAELVQRYLGAAPRAGKSRPPVVVEGEETGIYRAAGFRGPERFEVPGRVVVRTVDEIVAATFSLSGSTPHLFGARRDLFEGELRELLERAASGGVFSERMREIAVDIWR